MKINKIHYQELIIFSFIMVIFGFITSYLTDFILGKKIIFFPSHSLNMASGIFNTSAIVYFFFSNNYFYYKCNQKL